MLRGALSARPSFVCRLAAATGHRAGTHSAPTKIRAIRGPAACSRVESWPFPLVSGHARRVPPAHEEPAGLQSQDVRELGPGIASGVGVRVLRSVASPGRAK